MRRLILSAKLFGTSAAARESRWGWLADAAARIPTRALAVFAATGMLALVGAWAWQSDAAARHAARAGERLVRATAAAGLAVDAVYVHGRTLTQRAELRTALGITRDTPILALDPARARARIQRLPWVARAAVERDLPDIVRISLRERTPMARWQHRGSVQVLDRTGTPVRGAKPSRFADLPLVVGPGAPPETRRLLKILRDRPDVAKRVAAAVRVSQRRWNLRMHNDVTIKLPSDGVPDAWARLARLETRHGLLQRDIRAVDLRLPDQLLVRLAPGAEPYAPAVSGGEAT
jgi:cell division protein FtsQ